jgi:hypothetical protein
LVVEAAIVDFGRSSPLGSTFSSPWKENVEPRPAAAVKSTFAAMRSGERRAIARNPVRSTF